MNRPPEATLIDELQGCSRCDTLWVGSTRFGPFPLCPADALDAIPDGDVRIPAPIVAFDLPRAAPLRGCRKAPVMFVGINPNLTGFWTLPDRPKYGAKDAVSVPKGCCAVYPHFASPDEYARTYRYIREDHHEYAMEPREVSSLVDPERIRLIAADDGTTMPVDKDAPTPPPPPPDPEVTYRFGHARRVTLRIAYKNGNTVIPSVEWSEAENFVTVSRDFAAGELIAGVMSAESTIGRTVNVDASVGSSYYRLAQRICGAAGLVIGEDVSMHDMVACASQGWGKDIDTAQLTRNCVTTQGYALRQLRQSRPALVVFSGMTAFRMFHQQISAHLVFPPGVDIDNLEGHLKIHAITPCLQLELPPDANGEAWSATIVVVDHFSYPARSPKLDDGVYSSAWSAFRTAFPAAYELMARQDAAPEAALIERDGETWRISPDTWEQIARHTGGQALWKIAEIAGDPRPAAIGQLVTALQQQGHIQTAPSGSGEGRLARTDGACAYCTLFDIPEGCPYGKGIATPG